MENFKVGTLARYGLGYEQLHASQPGLIYCSITGFGQTGPYAPRPGYDGLVQAMGGVMSLTGEPDGVADEGGGSRSRIVFAGLYGCIGILAALRHREATGQGQQIDIGMLDTHVAWLANQGMNYLATGQNPPAAGQRPSQYRARTKSSRRLTGTSCCRSATTPLSSASARGSGSIIFWRMNGSPPMRRVSATASSSTDTLTPVMQGQTTDWWVDRLETAKIGCGPINTL